MIWFCFKRELGSFVSQNGVELRYFRVGVIFRKKISTSA